MYKFFTPSKLQVLESCILTITVRYCILNCFVCIVVSCLVCIVVSCPVCIVVVVLCVLLLVVLCVLS